MELNKVPTSTSTTISATSAATTNPLFDPVAFQTAYFAAQLQNPLQQNRNLQLTATGSAVITAANSTVTDAVVAAPHKVTTPTAGVPPFLDTDRLYSLLPAHLQSCLQQHQRSLLLQQQQANGPSLAHHSSAFSPINVMDLPAAAAVTASVIPSVSSSQPSPQAHPSQQQSIDLLLMQMQMATAAAAAAGFLPAAFNVLPQAAALGLLVPQFRLPQITDPNFPAYAAHMNLTPTISSTADDVLSKANDTSAAIERTLLQAQMQLLAANGTSPIVSDHECSSSSISAIDTINNNSSISFSSRQQLNANLNRSFPSNNNSSSTTSRQQQRISMKRPHEEMSTLRSLCNENYIAEEETVCRKRNRVNNIDENERRIRHRIKKARSSEKTLQQCSTAIQSTNNKDMPVETENSGTEKGASVNALDQNSPNRHHPHNHRPPAMEARFLECMAAIALHSNIPLPIKDEKVSRNVSTDINRQEGNGKLLTEPKNNPESEEMEKSGSPGARSCQSPDQPNESNEKVISPANRIKNEKYCERKWPNSAIDDELCQEMENYKDSDVPVIHAFVLPSKLPDCDASSPNSDAKSSTNTPYTVPRPVAVPVPVLNILLDRILQTMLDS